MKYKLLVAALVVVVAAKCASMETMESLARGYNALSGQMNQASTQEQIDAELSAYFAQELQDAGFDSALAAMNVRNSIQQNNPGLYVKIAQFFGSNAQRAQEYINNKVIELVSYIGQN